MSLADQLARIHEQMAGACARSHRAPESVRLLAATKTVAPERIREVYQLGLRLFGENRVQERLAKAGPLADLEAEWRLIGPLQSNKAAKAVEAFSAIDSVDSLALADRLSRLRMEQQPGAGPLGILLEINIGDEAQKHGIAAAAAPEMAQRIADLPGVELHGVMAVPPAATDAEDSRGAFARLAELAQRLRPPAAPIWEISMGMSHDFIIAIEEGSTLIRLGSALFGARPQGVL